MMGDKFFHQFFMGSFSIGLAATGLLLVPFSLPVLPLDVENEVARGTSGIPFVLKVGKGLGLNLSFLQTDEKIVNSWLDDPSRIVFSVDGGLCPNTQPVCSGKPSQIIHLKQINRIDFPNIPSSTNKSTLLSVVTQSILPRRLGRKKIYLFKVVPVDSGGQNIINVLPPLRPVPANNSLPSNLPTLEVRQLPPPTPAPIPSPEVRQLPPPVSDPMPLSTSLLVENLTVHQQADLLSNGLNWTKSRYSYRSSAWYKINTAIRSLREGNSLAVAAVKANVPLQELQKLIDFARRRRTVIIQNNSQKPFSGF